MNLCVVNKLSCQINLNYTEQIFMLCIPGERGDVIRSPDDAEDGDGGRKAHRALQTPRGEDQTSTGDYFLFFFFVERIISPRSRIPHQSSSEIGHSTLGDIYSPLSLIRSTTELKFTAY